MKAERVRHRMKTRTSEYRYAGRAPYLFALAFLVVGFAACTRPPAAAASGEGGWLAGTVDEKFETVAKQLRGFDMAMVETGYRYNELYWAARDRNWGYADYLAKKIRTAIENGLQRRPKRAQSAKTFLTIVLPAVEEAIARRDATLLRRSSRDFAWDVQYMSCVGKGRVRPGWRTARANDGFRRGERLWARPERAVAMLLSISNQ